MRVLLLLYILGLSSAVYSQKTGLPLGNEAYHTLDRLEIKTNVVPDFHSSLKYYLREDAVNFALKVEASGTTLSIKDREDLFYIYRDNNEAFVRRTATNKNAGLQKVYTDSSQTFYTFTENSTIREEEEHPYYFKSKKPILKHFYKTPANFWEIDKKDFYIRVNPIINGKAFAAKDDDFLFLNQRGISIRGGIDGKVFFYTNILESQARFADYVRSQIKEDRAVPGAGIFKAYKSRVVDVKDAHDFLLAQGYIGFNISNHLYAQLGHGRNFIGNGYRSMLLSNFGNNYFYLKLNARVWKFHYQTLFSELNAAGARDDIGDVLIPKKYSAMHHLSYNVTENLNIGFFEAIIFNRNNNFELQYLNPVILYRTVEGALGSPDNAFVGLDFKWNFLNRFQFYGQLLLDEFKFDELFIERRGWWANKYGIQLGLKYIDILGIDHLDGQIEYNSARPYTYTHRDSSASYTHYNQPLAHPLGANFQEIVFRLRYQAGQKWLIKPRLIYMVYGEDPENLNFGGDLLQPHITRVMDFNNEIGQGINTRTLIGGLDISYELKHNLNLDFHYFYRNKNSEQDELDLTTSYLGGGIRFNFSNRNLDF
jgi:hypothetical protein